MPRFAFFSFQILVFLTLSAFLNYQLHKINRLQNVTARFTVLKLKVDSVFILCMDKEKAILGRNKPRMSNFAASQPLSNPITPGQFMWEKPPSIIFDQMPLGCPGG